MKGYSKHIVLIPVEILVNDETQEVGSISNPTMETAQRCYDHSETNPNEGHVLYTEIFNLLE